MDQHPIPQDVTGFQFKLIGTMTVKQFGYVASGVISAVVLYYLPLHSAFGILFKVFMIPLLGASGVVVAFVPLEGRPIDVMATNFAKALFSPNQYVYHRQGRKLSFETISIAKAPVAKKTDQKTQTQTSSHTSHSAGKEEKLRALLLSSHGHEKTAIDKKEAAFLNALTLPSVQPPIAQEKPQSTLPAPSLQPVKSAPQFISPPPLPLQAKSPVQYAHPVTSSQNPPVQPQEPLQKEPIPPHTIDEVKPATAVNNTPAPMPHTEQKVTVLSKQLEEIHSQKQQLEQELSHLKTQLATQKGAPIVPPKPALPQQPLQDPLHVRTIPQDVTKKVGLPHVSDSPNVVVGIVKDPRGNILANILVEVKDKDGNPVRAFKTNQLGQFASATPLSPGTYTIELDDPKKQHKFDVIQISANNTVLLPIEIISHDAREELRKQLFAN